MTQFPHYLLCYHHSTTNEANAAGEFHMEYNTLRRRRSSDIDFDAYRLYPDHVTAKLAGRRS